MFGVWHEGLYLSEDADDEERSCKNMGDGYHEQECSTVVDAGRSSRGYACFRLDVDDGCCHRSLTQMDQAMREK